MNVSASKPYLNLESKIFKKFISQLFNNAHILALFQKLFYKQNGGRAQCAGRLLNLIPHGSLVLGHFDELFLKLLLAFSEASLPESFPCVQPGDFPEIQKLGWIEIGASFNKFPYFHSEMNTGICEMLFEA